MIPRRHWPRPEQPDISLCGKRVPFAAAEDAVTCWACFQYLRKRRRAAP